MTTELTVVTANIGRNVAPAETRANIVRVRHGFPGAVIGWQEIDEADQADEHKILEQTFGPDHYDNVAFRQAVPISVPNEWEVIDSDVIVACEGLAHATPRRFVVSALIKHPDLDEPVAILNGHYPLARLGGKLGRDRWEDTQASWTKRTLLWHRAGHTVITTRDTNRVRMSRLHPSERILTTPAALARITVVEGSVAVKVTGRRNVNLTIDGHDAKGVELALAVKSNA